MRLAVCVCALPWLVVGCRFGEASFETSFDDVGFDAGGTVFSYADSRDVALVENADPPVAKILDYGKFKYEAQKKANAARKKQKDVQRILGRSQPSLCYDIKRIRRRLKFIFYRSSFGKDFPSLQVVKEGFFRHLPRYHDLRCWRRGAARPTAR